MTLDVNATVNGGIFTDEEVFSAIAKLSKKEFTEHKEPVSYCNKPDMHFCYNPIVAECMLDYDESGNIAEITASEEVIKKLLNWKEKEETEEAEEQEDKDK